MVISQANRTALTLDAYLAARHLVVTPWNERQGVLDCELERQGYSRQVAMKTPLDAERALLLLSRATC